MNHSEATFEGVFQTPLFYQVDAPETPIGDIILVHGYAEHSNRYRHVIEYFNQADYTLWSYDHRGHGRSEGPRALLDRFDDLILDLAEFVRLVRSRNAGRPIWILGHSMGGLTATSYALDYSHQLQGLILSAPAFRVDHNSPKALLAVGAVVSSLFPATPVSPFDISGISRDAAVRESYETDPHNYIGPVKARLAHEMLLQSRYVQNNAHKLTLPVFMVVGDQDPIAHPQSGVDVFSRFSSRDKQLYRYPEALHEVLNEPEQHEILDHMRNWLTGQQAKLTT